MPAAPVPPHRSGADEDKQVRMAPDGSADVLHVNGIGFRAITKAVGI